MVKMFQKINLTIIKRLGEESVLQNNSFVNIWLSEGIIRQLTDEEWEVYREPYLEPGESRRPTLTWPREIPIASDGISFYLKMFHNFKQLVFSRCCHNLSSYFIRPGRCCKICNRLEWISLTILQHS